MKELTEQQEKVLRYISNRNNWRPPTIREISLRVLKRIDPKSVYQILKAVEKKGKLIKKGRYYYPLN